MVCSSRSRFHAAAWVPTFDQGCSGRSARPGCTQAPRVRARPDFLDGVGCERRRGGHASPLLRAAARGRRRLGAGIHGLRSAASALLLRCRYGSRAQRRQSVRNANSELLLCDPTLAQYKPAWFAHIDSIRVVLSNHARKVGISTLSSTGSHPAPARVPRRSLLGRAD